MTFSEWGSRLCCSLYEREITAWLAPLRKPVSTRRHQFFSKKIFRNFRNSSDWKSMKITKNSSENAMLAVITWKARFSFSTIPARWSLSRTRRKNRSRKCRTKTPEMWPMGSMGLMEMWKVGVWKNRWPRILLLRYKIKLK